MHVNLGTYFMIHSPLPVSRIFKNSKESCINDPSEPHAYLCKSPTTHYCVTCFQLIKDSSFIFCLMASYQLISPCHYEVHLIKILLIVVILLHICGVESPHVYSFLNGVFFSKTKIMEFSRA